MAIAIKPIPTLTDGAAERFDEIANANLEKAATVDFSTQREMAKKILAKSSF